MSFVMRELTIINDPVFVEPSRYSAYERFWLRFINDKRDLPFIHLLTGIHLLVVPTAILLFTPLLTGIYWWLLYIPYFYVSPLYFKGRFCIALFTDGFLKRNLSFYNIGSSGSSVLFLVIPRKLILHTTWECTMLRTIWKKTQAAPYVTNEIL